MCLNELNIFDAMACPKGIKQSWRETLNGVCVCLDNNFYNVICQKIKVKLIINLQVQWMNICEKALFIVRWFVQMSYASAGI